MKDRLSLVGLVGALLVAFVVAGCAGSNSSSSQDSTDGTPASAPAESSEPLFRVGMMETLDSMNPSVAESSDPLFTAVYPRLLRYSNTLDDFTPDLAKSWSTDESNKDVTFKLNTGGKWSDGRPVTADDVAFTFNTYLKYTDVGAAGVYTDFLTGIKSAEAVDPGTVVLHYDAPILLQRAIANAGVVPILPAHIWSKHTGNGGKDLLEFSNDPPVTGGPFILKDFKKMELALMERNPNFYGPRPPRVKQIGIKIYSSPDAMVSALKAGELDLASGLPSSALPAVRSDANLGIELGQAARFDEVVLNTRPDYTKHPSLKNHDVRTAMDLAIDRDNITEVVFRGSAIPSVSFLSPQIPPWHDPSVKPVYDPKKANELLDEAGYERGSDGIRSKAGEKLDYQVMIDSGSANAQRMFSLLKADMKEIGIGLTAMPQDLNALISRLEGSNDWDFAALSPFMGVDPDGALENFTCSGGFMGRVHCDPEFDRLTKEQRLTLDSEERVKLVHEAENIFAKNKTVLILDLQRSIDAYRKGWRGIYVFPDGSLSALSDATALDVYKD